MKNNNLFKVASVSVVAVALFTAPVAEASFFDVAANTEADKAIKKLTALKIINGYSDGSFKPKNSVTRAEAAKMLTVLHLNGATLPKSNAKFKDVAANHWAIDYIAYAKDHGWIIGDIEGNFKPDAKVTRAQFAKILTTYLNADIPNTSLPFKDVIPGAWYEDSIKVMLHLNITNGTTATTFSPESAVTREQFSIFLNRAKLLEHAPELPETPTVTPAQPNNVSFAALADPTKDYSAATLTKLLQSVNTLDFASVQSLEYNSPVLNIYDGSIREVKAGTYNYAFIRSFIDPIPQAEYMLRVTFDDKGVTNFKVYTPAQFAQAVAAISNGPQELSASIEQKLKTMPKDTEVEIETVGGITVNNVRLTNDSWYIEKATSTPTVIKANFFGPGYSERLFYVLTNETVNNFTSFSVQPLKKIQSFGAPAAGYEVLDIRWVNDGPHDKTMPAYDISKNQSVDLYALNVDNEPIVKGTEISIEYINFNVSPSKTYTHYYVFDGKKFVLKK